MLKLTMPKSFCLKKEKKRKNPISFALRQAGGSAGELRSALPLSKSQGGFTSSSCRVNVFLCSKTPF